MSRKIIGVTVGTPISPRKIEEKLKPVKTVNGITPDENGNVVVVCEPGPAGKDGATVEEVLAAVPAANSVKIAHAEDGTVTITMPMSDGTTDICVLNPGADGWPVSATLNGMTIPLEWEGW